MKELKENRKDVLVLDAGDLFFKKFTNPIPENELKKVTEKAQLILEGFNLMGVDALGIGDDDLTSGRDFLMEMSKKAQFPFLSSNIIHEDSGKLLFQPYLVKEIAGMKIGIFSLFSPDLFTGPNDQLGVEFGTFKMAGHEVSLEHRVTNIYKRETGGWKVVHHHTDTSSGMLDVLSRLQPQ